MHTIMASRRGPGMGQVAFVSPAVSVASAAVNTWLNQINLAHDADTATTQIVNGLEPLLRQNVNAYLAGPGTCEDQAAAIAAYQTAYQWLISPKGCGNGAYGSAGNRCISDRFGPGGAFDTNAKYPWASYYYTPIATDPRAAGCAVAVAALNPDAAEQAAVTNIDNLVTGNPVQTSAGQFVTPVASGLSSTVSIGSFQIPVSYLLISGAVLVVALAME